jgi:hypothetical protein
MRVVPRRISKREQGTASYKTLVAIYEVIHQ